MTIRRRAIQALIIGALAVLPGMALGPPAYAQDPVKDVCKSVDSLTPVANQETGQVCRESSDITKPNTDI
ncbi:hypothetical protein L3Q67_25770 [Saccharothrix sp. AJ9571]|nr:hypothetical protein L3Q67_25770 [Saccharothrix sp. AJ9571]